jgi:hypothetical protein
MTTFLFCLHGGNPHNPYPRDPYVLDETSNLQFTIMSKDPAAGGKLLYREQASHTEDAILFALKGVQALSDNVHRCYSAAPTPPTIYSVHPRSVLCRLIGYWGNIRGQDFPALKGVTHMDAAEQLAHPAILSVEERFALSPLRVARACNQPVLDKSDFGANILWQALLPFLQ